MGAIARAAGGAAGGVAFEPVLRSARVIVSVSASDAMLAAHVKTVLAITTCSLCSKGC